MTNVKKIALNSSVLAGGSILSRLLEFSFALLLTRYLTVDDYGNYNAILAYFTYFAIFIDLGTVYILRRECSRNAKDSNILLGNGISLSLTNLVFVLFLSYFIIELCPYPEEVKKLFWYASGVLFVSSRITSFRKLIEIPFLVNFKAHKIVISTLLDRIIFLICILVFIRTNNSLVFTVIALITTETVGFLYISFCGLKFGNYFKLRFDFKISAHS